MNYYKAIYPFVVVLKQKDDFLICFSLLEMPQAVLTRSLLWAVLTVLCYYPTREDPGCSFRLKTSMCSEKPLHPERAVNLIFSGQRSEKTLKALLNFSFPIISMVPSPFSVTESKLLRNPSSGGLLEHCSQALA